MAGFDPDDYGGYEGDPEEMFAVENAYHDAENDPARAIEILRDCYVKYQKDNDRILAVANDDKAIQWLKDYWQFVRDTEHGNEPSIAEIDGFSGFAQIIAYPDIAEQTMEYLLYDDYDKIDDEARDLIDRLTNLTGVSMVKMKKNQISKDDGDFDKKLVEFIRQFCRDKGLVYGYVSPENGGWVIRIDPYDNRGMEHPIEQYLKDWFKVVEPTDNFNEYYVCDEMIGQDDWYSDKSAKKMKKSIRKMLHSEPIQVSCPDGSIISLEYKKDTSALVGSDVYYGVNDYFRVELESQTIVDELCEDYDEEIVTIKVSDRYIHDFSDYYEKKILYSPSNIEIVECIKDLINNGWNKVMMKSAPSIRDMIAQTRANNNSLVKSRVDLKKDTKKENIAKMSWDDYKKLKRAYDNGTVDSLINSMNNVIPGYGNQFEALFDECMSIGSLKSYIYANYVPIEMPPLVRGNTNVYDSEGNDNVQFNFEGDGLTAMMRFTIVKNTDVNLSVYLWDNHEMVDSESQSYVNVNIDWIDELFSDADEIFRAVCQSYINMVRKK